MGCLRARERHKKKTAMTPSSCELSEETVDKAVSKPCMYARTDIELFTSQQSKEGRIARPAGV